MSQVLEPQFEGEVMKMPEGTAAEEATPVRRSHFSVWLVVSLLLLTILGGGGFLMWSQWQSLIEPLVIPSPIPTDPLPTPATSTPGIPTLTPPPSNSNEVDSIIIDLDNTQLDQIDNELDGLDETIYQLTEVKVE